MRISNFCPKFVMACSIVVSSISPMAQEPAPPREGETQQASQPASPADVLVEAPAPLGPQGAPLPGPNGEPPPGVRGRRGPGGFGMMHQEKKLVAKFDADGDKRLNAEERQRAREFLVKERAEEAKRRETASPAGPGPRPGGPPFGRRENQPPPQPGRKLTPADVKSYRAMPLYDMQTVRTYFLQFENPEWEKELADFRHTDVEVPAELTVDGRTYNDVGVHFRGASSLMMVSEGRKRSLNLSLDFIHGDQRLGGYRTLNLLNSNGDPTLLRAVLYNQIAREYIAAPKANYVHVVINGESWGIYVNVQQFNKDFVDEWFGTKKGERWKAPGRPGGNSGLEDLGPDVAAYKKRFEIKSKDDPKSWAALIELCRVLNQTPADQLEKLLMPLLDIDGALKFLALENVFINTDGYWTRASDFNLFRDENGRFHIIPHGVNWSRPAIRYYQCIAHREQGGRDVSGYS